MSTYIGWDVGIKNLAFCLLKDIADEGEPPNLKILNWNIIDLQQMVQIEELKNDNIFYLASRPKVKCYHPKSKTRKPCNKVATFVFKQNRLQGVCGIHCKKICSSNLYKCKEVPRCYHIITKKKKGKLQKISCSKSIAYVNRENTYQGLCTIHYKKKLRDQSILESEYIKFGKKKKANKIPLINLAQIMYHELDKIPELITAAKVIIENQPVYKNPTMKSVQILLYSYFVMKGIHMKDMTNGCVDDIICFSAGQKLKAFNGDESKLDQKVLQKIKGSKNKYQRTKKLGILYCEEMVKHSQESKWQDFFQNHKKKDDLADAYLTTCYYVQQNVKGK